ncbi:hypothetical protein I6F66_21260 [Pseudoalteromonas sp. NZS100_1]|nr:hypothetical protein [Pseudoalteromonas sp. NZS100_1]
MPEEVPEVVGLVDVPVVVVGAEVGVDVGVEVGVGVDVGVDVGVPDVGLEVPEEVSEEVSEAPPELVGSFPTQLESEPELIVNGAELAVVPVLSRRVRPMDVPAAMFTVHV